jgi:diguanylate cyclase (GGDEF)-like protein
MHNELIFPQTQLHISRGEQTSLVIVDLDEFKQINDQLGHQVGDEVIKAVAKILQAGTRQTDQVARYGGDEILIVLPFTEANEALDIAQRIRANTNQSLEVVFPDGSKKPVTLTMGISSSNGRKDLTSQELFQEADKALYAAKRDGRNRVYNYDPQSMENLDTNVPLPRD